MALEAFLTFLTLESILEGQFRFSSCAAFHCCVIISASKESDGHGGTWFLSFQPGVEVESIETPLDIS